jgi:hypothetical protein
MLYDGGSSSVGGVMCCNHNGSWEGGEGTYVWTHILLFLDIRYFFINVNDPKVNYAIVKLPPFKIVLTLVFKPLLPKEALQRAC